MSRSTPHALSIAPADPSRAAPLYRQVEGDLRRLIASGALGPGVAVPTEHDLSRRYNVSRQTVRQALGRLAADGLVTRTAGRGTFVTPHAERARFYLDRSFTQQMAELGQPARSEVLAAEVGTLGPDAPGPLRAHAGAPCLRLERLRLGGDGPIGLQRTTIRTDLCPGLDRYDFGRTSLYEVLARDYRLTITEIHHSVSAGAATPRQARRLQVEARAPLLVVGTAAFVGAGDAIEHTLSHYRPDRYEYRTRHAL